jgi:hypothetical protein
LTKGSATPTLMQVSDVNVRRSKPFMSELPENLPKNLKPQRRKDPFPRIHKLIAEIGVSLFALYELAKFVKFLYLSW